MVYFYDMEAVDEYCASRAYLHMRELRCEDEECCVEYPCEECRGYMDRKIPKLRAWCLGCMPYEACPCCGVKQYFLYGVGCETVGCVNYHVSKLQPSFCPF